MARPRVLSHPLNPFLSITEFLDRYKLVVVPTNAAWVADNAGTGGAFHNLFYLVVQTGTDPNSRGMFRRETSGLNSGDRMHDAVDYGKYLEWRFIVNRIASDPEAVARVQLKQVNIEGALTDVGIGLEIDNFDVYGEAYGTARDTVSLVTLSNNRQRRFKIVLIPGTRVEFWVDGVLRGTLTGDAVPIGVTTTTFIVASIINGATGGVNAVLYLSDIKFVQEW